MVLWASYPMQSKEHALCNKGLSVAEHTAINQQRIHDDESILRIALYFR